ncbi:MAG TPA: peptide deformylase [Candidatus Woesebacteria bacterium]|nr:peptide deformylase [Candidatus Woesebacteria bacterium]
MVLPIVKIPNKVLTTKTKQVTSIDAKIKKLITDMEDTLVVQTDPEGVGLAATQVGYGLSLFIMKPTKKAKARAFINPVIKKVVAETQKVVEKKDKSSLEGCLSIDRIWSPVRRPQKVLVAYMDEKGVSQEEWFEGFDAVIVQHEIDHLEGILFTQRALEQNKKIFKEINGELEEVQLL